MITNTGNQKGSSLLSIYDEIRLVGWEGVLEELTEKWGAVSDMSR